MTGSLSTWPTHLDSYGGCGTSVYALWPDADDDPMLVCSRGLFLHAVQTEEAVDDHTACQVSRLRRPRHRALAAVRGSPGAHCCWEPPLRSAPTVTDALTQCHGRPPLLLTVQDT